MTAVVSPDTAMELLRDGSGRVVAENELNVGGIRVLLSKFCPTWGPSPPWWRRWFLRARRQRVIFMLTAPASDYPDGYLFPVRPLPEHFS